MSGPAASYTTEPITPRGVVGFAHAGVLRLWFGQLVAAVLVALSVLWFFNDSCVPAVDQAIHHLGGVGEIFSGELAWHGDSPVVLAEERFLALVIDLNHTGTVHCTSDFQVEFGRDSIRVISLLGYADFYYPYNPPNQTIPVSREALEPLWGAWLPELQAILVAVVLVGLLLVWNVLATLYWLPVWLASWLAGRDLGCLASWRLAGASLLPCGLLLALGIFLFDFGVLDLVQISFVIGAHLLLGWIYLFVSLLLLPRRGSPKKSKKNPFHLD
jgi:hypothetical protein